MVNEFTAVIEQDGEWFIAYCPEMPGANGQEDEERSALQPFGRYSVDLRG